ncbi:IS200/IS605 family element transposase accessory protein TnpB [Hassallia byssoidea VB512170]|uniref:IS200/IS605 family element transposase accessory protein TnpB n=1 Tax=Hassallia byssoidea VB512170 TaxID=1304833 RepID=A0A846H6V9_9CYAN|nr:RNA-guided endonuclease TnpB family protein [Hassalia byssoidea]NEU73035.1 IS200/IS605 family element transposase accessory protein TnpB [Hassalia byssoidea VB512170]
MAELTLTLKLPFYRLNQNKVLEFERLTSVNTQVANELLRLDKKERYKLTSSAFVHVEIGSAWINQTIRNTNAKTKVKRFKRMWLETNNQNFEISKQGDLYTIAFNLLRGRKGRLPLSIHSASHSQVLDKIIARTAKLGSLKLCKSKKGIWYALVSVSMEVPDAISVEHWIGVDRGQNNIAVAALTRGFGKFWKGGRVKGLRRQFQRTRAQLQSAKQLKEVKRLEQRERRIMTHINHVISKQLVQFAIDFGMGLRFEDLSGCRQTMRQNKKTKSDAAKSLDSWAFYQLELFTRYKAIRSGIPVQLVPAAYTSKSDHRNGVIGKRNGDWFKGFDGYRCNADWNASQNIGQWLGFSCPLNLQTAVTAMVATDVEGGVNDSPLN